MNGARERPRPRAAIPNVILKQVIQNCSALAHTCVLLFGFKKVRSERVVSGGTLAFNYYS